MKQWEASYTMELTLLLPVIFLAMFLPIYASYALYQEVVTDMEYTWQQDFLPEKHIRILKYANELWGE